ncbi:hypothetical protein CCP3SC1AL1_1100002 [Gammaproteobacteria bacterium]
MNIQDLTNKWNCSTSLLLTTPGDNYNDNISSLSSSVYNKDYTINDMDTARIKKNTSIASLNFYKWKSSRPDKTLTITKLP